MSSDQGTSRLNNYLQQENRLDSLSWATSQTGPSNPRPWVAVCKIDGEPRGKGTASQLHVAKDIAADQAWTWLTTPENKEEETGKTGSS